MNSHLDRLHAKQSELRADIITIQEQLAYAEVRGNRDELWRIRANTSLKHKNRLLQETMVLIGRITREERVREAKAYASAFVKIAKDILPTDLFEELSERAWLVAEEAGYGGPTGGNNEETAEVGTRAGRLVTD